MLEIGWAPIKKSCTERIMTAVNRIAPVKTRIWSILVVEKKKNWNTVEPKLLEIPGVVRITNDTPVEWKTADIDQNDAMNCTDHRTLNSLSIKNWGQVMARLNPSCRTTPVCEDMAWPKLWAQRAVDADLMTDLFASLPPAKVTTKGAVVDSGFDSEVLAKKFKQSPTYYERLEKVKNSEDRGNHGTSSMSLIGASSIFPLPKGIDLSGFSASAGSLGDAFGQLSGTMEGLKSACESGAEVINASFGDKTDELEGKREEVVFKEFLDEMADHGCLIVKAAGNAGNKKVYDSDNPDGAMLRVGALDYANQEAEFSSHGEINAPGEKVFAIRSSADENFFKGMAGLKDKGNVCREKMGTVISGTSFSAPITSAIALRTLHLLKRSSQFTTLPGRERVKLLSRVLRAGSLGGRVNALRSAEIALAVEGQELKDIPSVEHLRTLLNSRVANECKKVKSCHAPTTCEQALACEKKLRWRTALCGTPLQSEDFELLLANHSYDLLLNGFIPSQSQAEKLLRVAYADNSKTFSRVLAGLIESGAFAKIANPPFREKVKAMARSALSARELPLYEAEKLFANLKKAGLFSLDLYSDPPQVRDRGTEQDNAFLTRLSKDPEAIASLRSQDDLNVLYRIYETIISSSAADLLNNDKIFESKLYDVNKNLLLLKILPRIAEGDQLLQKIASRDKAWMDEAGMLAAHFSEYPNPKNQRLIDEYLAKKVDSNDPDAAAVRFALLTNNAAYHFKLPQTIFEDYGTPLLQSGRAKDVYPYLKALRSQIRYFPDAWQRKYLSDALQSKALNGEQLNELVQDIVLEKEYDAIGFEALWKGPPPKVMPPKVREELFLQIATASENLPKEDYDQFWRAIHRALTEQTLVGEIKADWRESFEKTYGFSISAVEPSFRRALHQNRGHEDLR